MEGVIIVVHDVTDAVLIRTRAEQLALESRERADFEQQLIGIVSHDLRNPISAITLSAATMLRRAELDERQHRALTRIFSSAERASRMIRDLLDFTQARLGGGLPVDCKPMHFGAFLQHAVEELQVSHPARDITLVWEGAGEGSWDEDRLSQVLGNLLANALHYSAPSTPVHVRGRGESDEVLLEVHNLGTPIAEDVLPRLFQPMQRGAGVTDKSLRSVGLGLYIVDQLVRAHGGSIHVRSTVLEGTTFTVSLPRSPRL